MTAANKETSMQRLIVSEVARSLIPEDYVAEIVAALRAAGRLPAAQEAAYAR
jgi:hypothetical protein